MAHIKSQTFSMSHKNKSEYLLSELNHLTSLHYLNCRAYKNIVDTMFHGKSRFNKLSDIPYLHVNLFKHMEMKSIQQDDVFKILKSSGTSDSGISHIYLDKNTAKLQAKALASIVMSVLGSKRCPMIIVDSVKTLESRTKFNSRAAAILGFSNFGYDHFYLLNENMEVRLAELNQFLEKHKNVPMLIFGFTFMIWKYLYESSFHYQHDIDLSNCTLIHGGGWKRLANMNISEIIFKKNLKALFKLDKVFNYYGLIEQVGTVFIECNHGSMHVSDFSEVIIRDPLTLLPQPKSSEGLIQVISTIPHSYPGHSLLTEDLGEWIGEDDCACGRMGKRIKIKGRIPQSELRGCSDTYSHLNRSVS